MGRQATVNLNLPKRMRARVRKRKNGKTVTYYFYDAGGKPRKEIPLGCDYVLAVKEWANLEMSAIPKGAAPTFLVAAARYKTEVIPQKSPKTQIDNGYQLNKLLEFFGGDNPAPLDDIKPEHIKQYLQWRKKAPVAANRELALFSHIWTMCRPAEWGYTSLENPATGVTRFAEKPRDVYIEDYLYKILHDLADQDTKDAMDIAYLISQRPADVLKITIHHIKDDELAIVQNKTKAKLRFKVVGQLKEIIDRRMTTAKNYIIHNNNGGKISVDAISRRFAAIRAKATEQYPELADELAACQFRDLRAKSGTDAYLKSSSVEAAQRRLGHTDQKMTNVYIRRSPALEPIDDCGTPSQTAERDNQKHD